MTSPVQSPYSSEQTSIWLQGLLAIAWADGHFDDEEKELIAELTQAEQSVPIHLKPLEPIAPASLAAALGNDAHTAENFLRTAVMVAIADGIYSQPEDEVLQQFCVALGVKPDILESLRLTIHPSPSETSVTQPAVPASSTSEAIALESTLTVLQPVQEWLDQLEIQDPKIARFLCKLIPPQCPFERDVNLFGRKIAHIPALCKLNPLYDQLVGLRFRALSYLADDCGEDVSPYC